MDKKIIHILKTDVNNEEISHSLHLDYLIEKIKTKQKNIKDISYDDLLNKSWSKNDFVFIVHSFNAWNEETWNKILNIIPNNISIIMTEFIEDIECLQKTFNHKKINKIIVSSEMVAKFLQKNTKIEKNKIKYIPLMGENFSNKEPKTNPLSKTDFFPIIMIPNRLSFDKNYESILIAIHRLKFKYPKVLAIFLIKLSNTDSDKVIIDSLNDIIENLGIQNNVNLLVNPVENYERYLEYCDIILIPSKSFESMYYSTIVDAIKAQKPIIAPDVTYASDLCKKEAGILLYESNLDSKSDIGESIADNCSIIAENNDIKNILILQNAEMKKYFDENNILPQYATIMRKLKNSNDTSK